VLYAVKAGTVNSKSFVTGGEEDVMKIVGVRQDKSDPNAHRTTVSVGLKDWPKKLSYCTLLQG